MSSVPPPDRGDAGTGAGAPASIVVQRRIEWSDTDASGAHHNTAAFRFIEVAETTLLERLGLVEELYGRMPRVHIEADFTRPLRFRDAVDIHLSVAAVGGSSITYEFEMWSQGTVAVRGRAVAVLVSTIGSDPEPWPDRLRRLLLTAGPQGTERLVSG